MCGVSAQLTTSESPTAIVRGAPCQWPSLPYAANCSAVRRPGTLLIQLSSRRPSAVRDQVGLRRAGVASAAASRARRSRRAGGAGTRPVARGAGSRRATWQRSAAQGGAMCASAKGTRRVAACCGVMATRVADSCRRCDRRSGDAAATLAREMHQQQRDRRRRHAGNALRLADGFRPHAFELLPHFRRQAAHAGVVERRIGIAVSSWRCWRAISSRWRSR